MKDISVKIIIVLMFAFALMLFIFSPSAAQIPVGDEMVANSLIIQNR